ncbi:MAG: 3-hydroxybutyryl-CoA dehydrogenase [Bacteroidetes bacterium 4572_77]|nr:MAG: 3-hydroxybutyryl-CoA dehydrogenase [Bacteroidetes bacterium 4572_77]
MKIENVTIAGAGVLGSQIAWQVAFSGFEVTVYDAFEKGLEQSRKLHKSFAALFVKERGVSSEQINKTLENLSYTTDLSEAVKDADIISESVPENVDIKKSFYKELAKCAPEKTIFTTNSSTMLPSLFAEETGRPEKFLALHFANPVWAANIGEVMLHPRTDKKYFDIVLDFAKNIGMVPIPIYKEQAGYILNSLLIPLLSAGQNLFFNEVSDIESIDKTWMISTGAKVGPFGIIDMIGMQTVYNIALLNGTRNDDPKMVERAQKIKTDWIDKGKLGVTSGEGFYKYPNPRYQEADFLA